MAPATPDVAAEKVITEQRLCVAILVGVTLGHSTIPERIASAQEPRKLPIVLISDEVVSFLEAIACLKSRRML